MADWRGAAANLVSGYQIGRDAGGGRLSQLGSIIKGVADRLRSQREQGEQLGVLGQVQQIKNMYPSDLEKAQAKFYESAANQMGTGGGGIVYRNATTGEEVAPEIAIPDINAGNIEKYIISKKNITRSGITENPLIKPEDLTQEEKNYVITSKRLQTRLDNLLTDVLPKFKEGKFGNWQSFQAQSMPYLAIQDQGVQDFKSNLVALKADIPFLRGGKQLTSTEAKRVDILLNPLGKSEETYRRDIETFKKEFMAGEQLMRKGIKALNVGSTSTSSNQRVNVISPDGTEGDIPIEQLNQALAEGYRRKL